MSMLDAARRVLFAALTAAIVGLLGLVSPTIAQDAEKPYTIKDDGTVDWYTFSGFRRYHADCHVCHGPDGMGSSFAPSLVESLKKISYEDYLEVVTNGRKNVSASADKVMPAFGLNPNVMCFIDDIYAYLKARSDGVLPRGRPAKKDDKPQEAKERDDACLPTGPS
jgi:methanol metabolism-related c-type cytochrome